MKFKIIYCIKVLLTPFLIMSSQHNIFSQITGDTKVKPPGLFVGFSLGPSQSHIINEVTQSVSGLISNKMSSINGSADIGYFFSNHIGLSSGIGFDSYKTRLTLTTYQNKFNTVDSDNEAYERRVSGTDIKEDQEVGFLSIPICLNIRLPFNNTIGFFVQTGINLAFPLNKKYTATGIFTYKGYYPKYNVLLEDLPEYGFPVDHNTVANGELEIKPLNINALVSAGLDYFVQKKVQIVLAAFYNKSLSDISAYSSPDKFQLSSDVDQINSLMGGSSKVSIQSVGLAVKLRYYFSAPN